MGPTVGMGPMERKEPTSGLVGSSTVQYDYSVDEQASPLLIITNRTISIGTNAAEPFLFSFKVKASWQFRLLSSNAQLKQLDAIPGKAKYSTNLKVINTTYI